MGQTHEEADFIPTDEDLDMYPGERRLVKESDFDITPVVRNMLLHPSRIDSGEITEAEFFDEISDIVTRGMARRQEWAVEIAKVLDHE